MDLSSLSSSQRAGGQIALAAVLAIVGFVLLLPRPRGRSVMGGIAALIAAVAVFGAWLHTTFGKPIPDLIGTALFVLFSAGALGFGVVLVVQRNPARGAIAFAFVILSTCGLFLLLAAPFLMAVTIIVYAGAIIVTFLFVLMLSQVEGPSNENDRSREPLFGALAGFAFTGLVLFTLYLTAVGSAKAIPDENVTLKAPQRLPAAVLTATERDTLLDAVARLDVAEEQLAGDVTPPGDRTRVDEYFEAIRNQISTVVGSVASSFDGTLHERLEKSPTRPGEKLTPRRLDQQAQAVLQRAADLRKMNDQVYKTIVDNVYDDPKKKPRDVVKADLRKLRDEVVLLASAGELPARNVGNLGYLLYTDNLLAVELAGTLLLVASIGAIAIAQRKGAAA